MTLILKLNVNQIIACFMVLSFIFASSWQKKSSQTISIIMNTVYLLEQMRLVIITFGYKTKVVL